jgi:hypothetical protein
MPRTFCNLHKAHSFASYNTKGDAGDLPSNPDPHGMAVCITLVGKKQIIEREEES